MARAQSFDYLHNMRFHAEVVAEAGGGTTIHDLLNSKGNETPQAGFSSVTIPEASLETQEYREGQFLYTRKYPGHVTFNDVTLMRGVAMTDLGFWKWMETAMVGTGEYRVELAIYHYHRADTLPGPGSVNLKLDSAQKKTYLLHEALPIRQKLAADLDATDSAVSIMELDVAYEWLEVKTT